MTPDGDALTPFEAALRYAGEGIPVLPMHWPTAQWSCSCGCVHPKCWRRAKHPLVPFREASLEATTIRGWWERWPHANVGVSTANLLVIDADVRGTRLPDLAELAARWSMRADGLVVSHTGSGGFHLFFRRPEGRHSKGKDRLGPGLDVQSGSTGFVVAPPSRHYNLQRYAWLPGAAPWESMVSATPEELLRELTGFPPPRWLLHAAPYWASDRLHLSVETRHRIRRILRMK